MEKESVNQILREIFHQIAPEIIYDSLDKSIPLRDQVEIDSFDFYNMIVMLQKQIHVMIPDSKLSELKNLNQLIDFIIVKNKDLK